MVLESLLSDYYSVEHIVQIQIILKNYEAARVNKSYIANFRHKSRSWISSKEKNSKRVGHAGNNRLIWFGAKGDNVPRKKTFLSEVKGGSVPMTIWKYEDVGSTQDAKKEVKQINPEDPFATPKPEKLVERILEIATQKGDYVLDSFLGSGTTIAVAHKMQKKMDWD